MGNKIEKINAWVVDGQLFKDKSEAEKYAAKRNLREAFEERAAYGEMRYEDVMDWLD